jgi:hypothetical protein
VGVDNDSNVFVYRIYFELQQPLGTEEQEVCTEMKATDATIVGATAAVFH